MPTIRLTDRTPAARSRPATRALLRAAISAQRAPSIFNTQPWQWTIHDDTADLRADRSHHLPVVDPEARMLTLSCGAALHHARVALTSAGHVCEVHRVPDPRDPDLLATMRIAASAPAPATAVRLHQAIALRRTDRRPFADQPVPDAALERLRTAAQQHGAHLHLLRPDDVVLLSVAANRAARAQLTDPEYRDELAAWTHQAADTGAGVPPDTAGPVGRWQVPVRDFAPDLPSRPVIADVADRQARYAVLFTHGDDPLCWLTAGEALSAVLLTATAERLATSPMSDVIEVPAARHLLYELIGCTGHPMVALRIGIPADPARSAPGTPRRSGAALTAAAEADS